jgi:hypothetical protein
MRVVAPGRYVFDPKPVANAIDPSLRRHATYLKTDHPPIIAVGSTSQPFRMGEKTSTYRHVRELHRPDVDGQPFPVIIP